MYFYEACHAIACLAEFESASKSIKIVFQSISTNKSKTFLLYLIKCFALIVIFEVKLFFQILKAL